MSVISMVEVCMMGTAFFSPSLFSWGAYWSSSEGWFPHIGPQEPTLEIGGWETSLERENLKDKISQSYSFSVQL